MILFAQNVTDRGNINVLIVKVGGKCNAGDAMGKALLAMGDMM